MVLLKEKKYYDGFAEYWDRQFTSRAGRNFRNRKLLFLRECLDRVEGVALDVGCATGFFTSRLGDDKRVVVGVDMSEGMVRYAGDKHPDTRFVVCPAELLSTKFGDVDCIFMMGVFTLDSAAVLLGECRKVLREGGKLVVITGNGLNFYLRFIYNLLYPTLPARLSTVNSLESTLARYGFRVTRRKVFHLVPFMVPDWLFGVCKFVEGKLEGSFLVSFLGSIIGVESVKVGKNL